MRKSFTIQDLPISERPREKIIRSGGGFYLRDKELLAAILGRGIAKESVLITAERLLTRFRTIDRVLRAPIQDLMMIRGIGPAKAAQLKAVLEAGKRTFGKKIYKKIKVQPFLKWAGGKAQLLEQYAVFFPQRYNRYFEPFLGGGAVFFYLEPNKAILGDYNKNLIQCFLVVKNHVKQLIDLLKIHRKHHNKEYYGKMRKDYNTKRLGKTERTAIFIYLNKTCFNGLYRVNSKGGFNVPFGKYRNPAIFDEENLLATSKLLKRVKLYSDDFSKILDYVKKDDFVYLDPPYYPLSKTSSFTNYTSERFLEDEQKRLANVFRKLDKKKCKVMLSNSDTKFIKNLYKDYRIETVKANRNISCVGNKRGPINELVILNY
ncbi:MAG: Dam family site-specific DNA-(adenine-N6)-methyltransferase [Candidatus Nealsonbacteria bacterium]